MMICRQTSPNITNDIHMLPLTINKLRKRWLPSLITIFLAVLFCCPNDSAQQGGAGSATPPNNNRPASVPLANADIGGSFPSVNVNGASGGGGQAGISTTAGGTDAPVGGSLTGLGGSNSGGSNSGSGISNPAPAFNKPEGLSSKVKGKMQQNKDTLKSSDDNLSNNNNNNNNGNSERGGLGSIFSSPSTSQKPEGLFDKISEAAHRSKETFDQFVNNATSSNNNTNTNTNTNNNNNSEGFGGRIKSALNKGSEAFREGVHRAEDRLSEIGHNLTDIGSSNQNYGGGSSKSGEGLFGNSNTKDSQRSGIFSNNNNGEKRNENKTLAVELFDKAHEVVKMPVETFLKPLDKALGYNKDNKDPLIKIYDEAHDTLRKPLGMISKPVEDIFQGAFKTTDESMIEARNSGRVSSDTNANAKFDLPSRGIDDSQYGNRTITGTIADKTFELSTKPIEIILRPIDKALGFAKVGKKNPILSTIDELYKLSKKPIDKIARPFEKVLKKMALEDYQVSIRYGHSSNSKADPKLITRLADGALNIADRIFTRPLDIIMKPFGKVLGYEAKKNQKGGSSSGNPIVEATHSLKNATKLGVELFTKPIDRIIHEIAEIGEHKSSKEREQEMDRQKEDASRLVRALDKIHEIVQAPFELVLTPVSKAIGITKEGRREPFLHAWDIVHQVLRTPVQIISKPVEDALLGERSKQEHKSGKKNGGKGNNNYRSRNWFGIRNKTQGNNGSNNTNDVNDSSKKLNSSELEDPSNNVIVDGIKKIENIATKPIEMMTSPIRRLILGGSPGSPRSSDQSTENEEGKDKIVQTLENVNNAMLKPLEVITQPIAEIIRPEKKNSNSNDNIKPDGSSSSSTSNNRGTTIGGNGNSSNSNNGPNNSQANSRILRIKGSGTNNNNDNNHQAQGNNVNRQAISSQDINRNQQQGGGNSRIGGGVIGAGTGNAGTGTTATGTTGTGITGTGSAGTGTLGTGTAGTGSGGGNNNPNGSNTNISGPLSQIINKPLQPKQHQQPQNGVSTQSNLSSPSQSQIQTNNPTLKRP